MANKTITLIDDVSGDEMYPATLASQVFDNNSQTVQSAIDSMIKYKDAIAGEDITNPYQALIDLIYPIGTIYITTLTSATGATSPASWLGGSWERLPDNYTLWTASSGAGNTIPAGLPNITGSFEAYPPAANGLGAANGAFRSWASGDYTWTGTNASTRAITHFELDVQQYLSSSIYGNSSTVQPPAYKVYAWKRIA